MAKTRWREFDSDSGGAVKTLSALNDTVEAGTYEATTLSAVDPDLATGNIKAGVTIFGISGKAEVVDTTEASNPAGAAHITLNKVAFVNGAKVTGTAAAVSTEVTASGALVSTSGTYAIYLFGTSGTITFPAAKAIDYLIVAGGGGGGGYDRAGGGGGGGVLIGSKTVNAGAHQAIVGTGGNGGGGDWLASWGIDPASAGSPGGDSIFDGLVAYGGGGGGGREQGYERGLSGGNGGGVCEYNGGSWKGGAGFLGQGTNGGNVTNGFVGGAGGGGKGGTGGHNSATKAGNGGPGTSCDYSGTTAWYGGGGGGGDDGTGFGIGGTGGGGNGASSTSGTAGSGLPNTGGGGGGMGVYNASTGGKGGSGIVIIRFGI